MLGGSHGKRPARRGKIWKTLIAICVTLLLGVTGFIINSFVQRKSNSINVITKTRLARREKTKELMAKMIKLSNIDYLDFLEKKEHKEVISSLAEVTSEIRSEYSSVFPCDQKLINATYALSSSVITYLGSPDEESKESLITNRDNFIKEMDLYIQTEWKRIKMETVGKMKNNKKPSWDDIHDDYQEKYK